MTDKRFMVIHLGNPFDFVVKDLVENKTYGTFQGDSDSMKKLCDDLDELHEENQQIKHIINEAIRNERTELGKSTLRQLRDRIQ